MNNKPSLPSLDQITIIVLRLSPDIQAFLSQAEIHTIAQLFSASEKQQKNIADGLTQTQIKELVQKARRFHRTYLKIRVILKKWSHSQLAILGADLPYSGQEAEKPNPPENLNPPITAQETVAKVNDAKPTESDLESRIKTSVDELGLSIQASKVLHDQGVDYIEQLLQLTRDELISLPSFSPQLVSEIEDKLETYLNQPLPNVRFQYLPESNSSSSIDNYATEAHLQTTLAALEMSPLSAKLAREAGIETVRDWLGAALGKTNALAGIDKAIVKEIQNKVDSFLIAPITVVQEETIPSMEDSSLQDTLTTWFDLMLTTRQRAILEQRYGLLGEEQTLEAVGKKFGVVRERIRQIQEASLRRLRNDLSPIEHLFLLVEKGLNTTDGILPLQVWLRILEQDSIAVSPMRPQGILSLLAGLEDKWAFYNIDLGVLCSANVSRTEVEDKVTSWRHNLNSQVNKVEVSPLKTVLEEAAEEESALEHTRKQLEFVSDHLAVLENVRNWNHGIKTEAGKSAWGTRIITYFVYDPQSQNFAPSKFCAYSLGNEASSQSPLTIIEYAQIEHDAKNFDGQQARNHLSKNLGFQQYNPIQDSTLHQMFEKWLQSHAESITVHPNGPKILRVPSDSETRQNRRSKLPDEEIGSQSQEPAKRNRHSKKKVTTAELASIREHAVPIDTGLLKQNPFYATETELRRRMKKVDFIGEMAIDRSTFTEWCGRIQKEAFNQGKPEPRLVPPAFYVVLMVFTARYSEEEARNFWRPYAQMVWGLNEANSNFQMRCREWFKDAINFLSKEYDLVFPQKTSGDLVRPIYRHAIIPAYLEKEFVDWLKAHWREIQETPEGFLIPQLRQERSLNYLSPTLRKFIIGADTAETAAALIRNMSTAAGLYADGEPITDIHDLLAENPIEQTLWDELSQIYAGQSENRNKRRQSFSLEWVWNLEQNEMQLRLRNLLLSNEVVPYQVVWVEKETPVEDAAFADVYELLEPWEIGGDWLIDEIMLLPDGPLEGELVVLSEDDSLLWKESVPPLPAAPVQFFRMTQQDLYAVPKALDNIQLGQYLITQQANISFVMPEGETLKPLDTLTLPYLLQDRFEEANLYEIVLPLKIEQAGAELETLLSPGNSISILPPYIDGTSPIKGLSKRVPPLYSNSEIWLILPKFNDKLLEQVAVEVRPQKGKRRRRLLRDFEMEIDEKGALWIPLQNLISFAGGTYTVELRRGLRSLLPAPLQFSYIPSIAVTPPPIKPENSLVYTPKNPPVVHIAGVEEAQIHNRGQLIIKPTGDDAWQISWKDLRGGCRLGINVNGQQVPLEWKINKLAVWIEPYSGSKFLTQSEFKESVLHAAGTPGVVDFFFIKVGNENSKRQLQLNRRGRLRLPMRQDQLFDVVRHHRGSRVEIYGSVFGEEWLIFTLRRHPELGKIRIGHDPIRRVLVVDNELKESWQGRYHFQAYLLSNPSATPQILQSVNRLDPNHTIPCDLSDGAYLFEIWDPETQQALAKKVFGIGQTERSALFREAVDLLESLSNDQAVRRLPRWLGDDMVRFLAAEAERDEEGDSILAAEWLWQLAVLKPRTYKGVSDEELATLWRPLWRLRQVGNSDEWRDQYGLLPDWAIMPTRLILRFERSGSRLEVEPELVFSQGKQGIGYGILKFNDEQTYVYVRWEPHRWDQVKVTLGIPGGSPDEMDFAQLDDLDMYPVYQCQQCGWFVDSSVDPEIIEQHKHRYDQPVLEDVLNHPGDYQLLAEITVKRKGSIRTYPQEPQEFADREKVAEFLQNLDLNLTELRPPAKPIANEAYLAASWAWAQRFHTDSTAAKELEDLTGNIIWRHAFIELAKFLENNVWFRVPAWGALGRFLKAFHWNSEQHILNLDLYALLIALVVRTAAHDNQKIKELKEHLPLNDVELAKMLKLLNRHCPELLEWAFIWTEIFFVHAAG